MNSPSLATLRVLLPLLLLGGLGVFLWRQDHRSQSTSDPLETAIDESGRITTEDFGSAPDGGLPTGWEIPRGTFRVVDGGLGRVLEFSHEPMVEGRAVLPGVLKGGGTIRARFQGDRAKRTFPRFGVGLGQEAAFKLQALPGESLLRLVQAEQLFVNEKPIEEDRVLASVPWTWIPESWCWVELSVRASGNSSVWEGRAWAEGAPRPTQAMLNFTTETPPKLVRPTLHVAPYALKPIYINRVETIRSTP